MQTRKYFLLTLFALVAGKSILWAQLDTTATLPDIVVSAASLRDRFAGERIQQFDSLLPHFTTTDLGVLLGAKANIYIKSYGLGSLATSTMRGGSAGHTAITWNGVPLQSPMLGLGDLALIPVFMLDKVAVHAGSAGAQWGSSAVGGRIALGNQFSEKKGHETTLQGGIGSFDRENLQVKHQFISQKWATTTRFSYTDATNNFPWKINDTLPEKTQQNAATRQWAFGQNLLYKMGPNQKIEGHFWWQHNYRQIPPTSTQNKSGAHQQDLATRSTLQWEYRFQRSLLTIKTAFIEEAIDYRDTLIRLKAKSKFQTFWAETENRWTLHPFWTLQTGFVAAQYRATADGYREGVQEWRPALFTNLQFARQKWTVQAGIRQEWIDGRAISPIPAIGAAFRAAPAFTFKAKITRQYRLPTLNDRFWQPGGNPNLLPEQGWSTEAGFVATAAKVLHYEATLWHRRMFNWILWSQAEGQSFWSSNNITEVLSRGLEQQLAFSIALGHVKSQWLLNYNFTRSTNEKALAKPKMAVGEQLLYVPVHQGSAALTLTYRHFSWYYQHRYVGKVRGINEELAAWQTGFTQWQVAWNRWCYHGIFFIQVDNIWNKNYRVIERRPMPGRNYQTGVTIKF